MYTAYTFQNRAVLVARWQTIFIARKQSRAILHRLKAHQKPARIWKYFVHETSGEYEVWFLFGENTDTGEVVKVLTQQPPYSNRGVTPL